MSTPPPLSTTATVLALAALASVALPGCNRVASHALTTDSAQLLARYEIKVEGLACSQVMASREGWCEFTVAPAKVGFILTAIEKNRSEQLDPKVGPQPAGLFRSAPCRDRLGPANPVGEVLPMTQLGGGALPYLGPIRFERATGRFCLAVEYGYG